MQPLKLHRHFFIPVKDIAPGEYLLMFVCVQRAIFQKLVPVIEIPLPEVRGLPISLVCVDKHPARFQAHENLGEEEALIYR